MKFCGTDLKHFVLKIKAFDKRKPLEIINTETLTFPQAQLEKDSPCMPRLLQNIESFLKSLLMDESFTQLPGFFRCWVCGYVPK